MVKRGLSRRDFERRIRERRRLNETLNEGGPVTPLSDGPVPSPANGREFTTAEKEQILARFDENTRRLEAQAAARGTVRGGRPRRSTIRQFVPRDRVDTSRRGALLTPGTEISGQAGAQPTISRPAQVQTSSASLTTQALVRAQALPTPELEPTRTPIRQSQTPSFKSIRSQRVIEQAREEKRARESEQRIIGGAVGSARSDALARIRSFQRRTTTLGAAGRQRQIRGVQEGNITDQLFGIGQSAGSGVVRGGANLASFALTPIETIIGIGGFVRNPIQSSTALASSVSSSLRRDPVGSFASIGTELAATRGISRIAQAGARAARTPTVITAQRSATTTTFFPSGTVGESTQRIAVKVGRREFEGFGTAAISTPFREGASTESLVKTAFELTQRGTRRPRVSTGGTTGRFETTVRPTGDIFTTGESLTATRVSPTISVREVTKTRGLQRDIVIEDGLARRQGIIAQRITGTQRIRGTQTPSTTDFSGINILRTDRKGIVGITQERELLETANPLKTIQSEQTFVGVSGSAAEKAQRDLLRIQPQQGSGLDRAIRRGQVRRNLAEQQVIQQTQTPTDIAGSQLISDITRAATQVTKEQRATRAASTTTASGILSTGFGKRPAVLGVRLDFRPSQQPSQQTAPDQSTKIPRISVVETSLGQRTSPVFRPIDISSARPIIGQRSRVIPFQTPRGGLRQSLSQVLIQSPAQQQIQLQQPAPFAPPLSPLAPPPIFIPIRLPNNFFIGALGRRRQTRRVSGRKIKGFRPSLTAGIFKIFGRRERAGEFTGLGIRPQGPQISFPLRTSLGSGLKRLGTKPKKKKRKKRKR